MAKKVDYNGFWKIDANPLSKVGVFPYLGKQISDRLDPNKIYMVYRPAEELFSKDAIDSFNKNPVPLIENHEMIGKGFTPAEKKGVEGVINNIRRDGDKLIGDISIYSDHLKDKILGGKKDLSMGYFCNYDISEGDYQGHHYDAVQRDIRSNHVALVDRGRMGSDVRVYDSFTFDCAIEAMYAQDSPIVFGTIKQASKLASKAIIKSSSKKALGRAGMSLGTVMAMSGTPASILNFGIRSARLLYSAGKVGQALGIIRWARSTAFMHRLISKNAPKIAQTALNLMRKSNNTSSHAYKFIKNLIHAEKTGKMFSLGEMGVGFSKSIDRGGKIIRKFLKNQSGKAKIPNSMQNSNLLNNISAFIKGRKRVSAEVDAFHDYKSKLSKIKELQKKLSKVKNSNQSDDLKFQIERLKSKNDYSGPTNINSLRNQLKFWNNSSPWMDTVRKVSGWGAIATGGALGFIGLKNSDFGTTPQIAGKVVSETAHLVSAGAKEGYSQIFESSGIGLKEGILLASVCGYSLAQPIHTAISHVLGKKWARRFRDASRECRQTSMWAGLIGACVPIVSKVYEEGTDSGSLKNIGSWLGTLYKSGLSGISAYTVGSLVMPYIKIANMAGRQVQFYRDKKEAEELADKRFGEYIEEFNRGLPSVKSKFLEESMHEIPRIRREEADIERSEKAAEYKRKIRMERYGDNPNNEDGDWITVRGRHIFIPKRHGKDSLDIYTHMIKSRANKLKDNHK